MLVLLLLLSFARLSSQQPSSASSLETEINKTGGAFVYGITFERDAAFGGYLAALQHEQHRAQLYKDRLELLQLRAA